jgi:hypothetical protein
MNPHTNGAKVFLYVIQHIRHGKPFGQNTEMYVVKSDHDPDPDELVRALSLDYDEMHDEIEAIRYSEESVPTIPPKHS